MPRTKRFRNTSKSCSLSHDSSEGHSESLPHMIPDYSPSRHTTNLPPPRGQWRVTVIEANGSRKDVNMKSSDVWDLKNQKVVIPFDIYGVPTKDAAGMYAYVLGQLACDPIDLPIDYDDWRKIPKAWKDDIFDNGIKTRFHFDVAEPIVRSWTLKNMGKKWKDFKGRLWHEFNDSSLSIKEMYENVPDGVPRDQWKRFVDKNNEEKYKDMCKRNASNRQKQQVTHTSGSKSFARKRDQLTMELGRSVGRTEFWFHVHMKPDGSYVNNAARDIGEQIEDTIFENPSMQSQIVAQCDALAKVCGKEHPGRVRGLGFGPTPSNVFGRSSRYLSGMTGTSSNSSEPEMQVKMQSLESELKFERERRLNLEGALASVFQKMLGTVPDEIASLISRPPSVADTSRTYSIDSMRSSNASHDVQSSS